MPFFQTCSNYSLHYELHGDGPDKVLCIIGFGCCKAYWSPLVERLLTFGLNEEKSSTPTPPSSSRYQICVFDSRGFGLSGDSFALYSSANLARDTKSLLMHLRWIKPERALLKYDLERNSTRDQEFVIQQSQPYLPPPLHIVGWSMGGMVLLELTLDLVSWSEEYKRKNGTNSKSPNCMDFRSSVITASSRGGFTHRGERYDAEPEPGEKSTQKPPPSCLKRFLRRSAVGRYGWGRTWFLRNIPPVSGLVRMFQVVFLSLYHSRIEKVLELHYSLDFLNQPYVEPSHASAPPASAISHLPLASAALTSSDRSTIEVHTDLDGSFTYSQEANSEPLSAKSAGCDSEGRDGGCDADDDADDEEAEGEVEEEPTPQDDLKPEVSLGMTPQLKRRVLEMEETQSLASQEFLDSPSEKRHQENETRPLGGYAPHHKKSNSASLTRSYSSSSTTSLSSSTPRKVLTNRDVLSSQYLLRAPFDRYIFQYFYALMGHGLTCLTHHVSRKRIHHFLQQLSDAVKRKDPHLLRLLVITGSADILVHPSNSYHLSEQLHCPLYVLAGVGHMVHVEQPDAFAQLLHAHFTRQSIHHLEAYTHRGQQPIPPSPISTTRRTDSTTNLTLTRLDGSTHDLNTLTNTGLTPDELDSIAARRGPSRRNSFLVHIDADSCSSAGGSTNVSRNTSQMSLASNGSFSSLPNSASPSRRPSLAPFKRTESSLTSRSSSCLTRLLTRVTNLPLRTAKRVTTQLVSLPSTVCHLVLHPSEWSSIPSRCFQLVTRGLGGSVFKRNSSASSLSARVITNA